jgi:hypothetical protein
VIQQLVKIKPCMDDVMFDTEKTFKLLTISFGLTSILLGSLTYRSFTSKWQGIEYGISYLNGYMVPSSTNPSISKWYYLLGAIMFGIVAIGALCLYLISPKDIGRGYEQYLHESYEPSKDEKPIEDKIN